MSPHKDAHHLKKQASIAEIGPEYQTVINFSTDASFTPDMGNRNKPISDIVVQATEGQRLPISIEISPVLRNLITVIFYY